MRPDLGRKRFAVGRLAEVPIGSRRGHAVRARAADAILDVTQTDGSGRFLVEWVQGGQEPGQSPVSVELLDAGGAVSESIELSEEDLVSPPVLAFSGAALAPAASGGRARRGGLEADGDSPVCVASSCIEVVLSWSEPPGSRVSILPEGEPPLAGLPAEGSMRVTGRSSRRYAKRVWREGARPEECSESLVEVKRYPSLSLVYEDRAYRTAEVAEFGVSTSCDAEGSGLRVSVLTSDAETFPQFELTVPRGSRWAVVPVRVGGRPGEVSIVARAPGYARDAVTLQVARG